MVNCYLEQFGLLFVKQMENSVLSYFTYQTVPVVTKKKLINAGAFSSDEQSVLNWTLPSRNY